MLTKSLLLSLLAANILLLLPTSIQASDTNNTIQNPVLMMEQEFDSMNAMMNDLKELLTKGAMDTKTLYEVNFKIMSMMEKNVGLMMNITPMMQKLTLMNNKMTLMHIQIMQMMQVKMLQTVEENLGKK